MPGNTGRNERVIAIDDHKGKHIPLQLIPLVSRKCYNSCNLKST